MSIKVQLAELCANRKLPMDEYKKLSAFSALEQRSDVIENLESFRLPEITKLICGSEILSAASWAVKYQPILPLYCNPQTFDVVQIILKCKTAETLEKDILRFADADILKAFSTYYDDLIARQAAHRKERTRLTRKIREEKKKSEESTVAHATPQPTPENNTILEDTTCQKFSITPEAEPTPDEKTLEALKLRQTELDQYLKQHKAFIEKIRIYKEKVQETDSDENREAAYRSLHDIKTSHEEAFLQGFISSGVVSEEYHVQFRDQGFLSRVLRCLEKGSFKNYSVPILLKLYDEGAIDLIEGSASDFINQHPDMLCDYLVEKTPPSAEDLDSPEFELLIEKAIQKEISNSADKKSSFFAPFWNTITDHSIWRWIIYKTDELADGENIATAISCILLHLKGKSAKSFVEVIFDDPELEIKLSTVELISVLTQKSGMCSQDVIIETVRLLEQRNRKIQRRLNTSERKLRSQGQELFSSVYLPMEQLEELAINLKLTNGDIKSSLVAAHLIDIVLSLREGFETLDLQPVADVDDWKYQNKIVFDPCIHRVTTDSNGTPDVVQLRSLGFRYQDDDGEWQQYNAQASVEVDLPAHKKEPRKGYPKYEQPGEKKNSGSVHRPAGKPHKKISAKSGHTHKKRPLKHNKNYKRQGHDI